MNRLKLLLAGYALIFFTCWQGTLGGWVKLRWIEPSTMGVHAAAAAGSLILGLLFPNRLYSIVRQLARAVTEHSRWVLAGLALSLFFLLIVINRASLQSFMNSGDEFSCFFLAECLLSGKLWAPVHPLKEFFTVVHIGDIGGKWFSVYPPGWPLLWAPWIRGGLKDFANPFYATLAFYLYFKIGEIVYSKKTAILAAILLILSPFFLLNGASYYSHPSCMLLLAGFLYASLRWKESKNPFWACAGGMCFGLALATRYLTAVAFGIPILAGLFWIARHERENRWRSALAFGIPAALITGLLLFTHFLITGNPFDFPNHYLHSHERLGFIAGYTPATALSYLWQRFQYLIEWTPPLFILFLILGLLSKKKSSWDLILRMSAMSLPAAYLFYYSWGGNQFGPRYYFEALPMMALVAAQSLVTIGETNVSPKSRLTLGVILSIALFSLPQIHKYFIYYRQVSLERSSLYHLVEKQTEKPALVFLKGFLGNQLVLAPEDTVRNDPFFRRPVVFAKDLGPENAKLLSYFPQFHYYRAYYDRNLDQPFLEPLDASITIADTWPPPEASIA